MLLQRILIALTSAPTATKLTWSMPSSSTIHMVRTSPCWVMSLCTSSRRNMVLSSMMSTRRMLTHRLSLRQTSLTSTIYRLAWALTTIICIRVWHCQQRPLRLIMVISTHSHVALSVRQHRAHTFSTPITCTVDSSLWQDCASTIATSMAPSLLHASTWSGFLQTSWPSVSLQVRAIAVHTHWQRTTT